MTVTALPTATADGVAPRGWASKDDTPEMFQGVRYVWKRRRLAAGLKQSSAIRRLIQLATDEGVPVASPSSLKIMLSRWENGATVSAAYKALLLQVYGIRPNTDADRLPARYRNNAIYTRQFHVGLG
jgi:hypothetical protein